MDKMNSSLMALLFLLSAVLLMKSDSKTALLSLLTGVAVYAVFGISFISRNAHLAGRLAIGSVVALYVLLFPMNMFETLLNLMGRDATLTDRVYLWEDIIALVENPILGAGFDSFWLGDRLTVLWDKWWFQPNEAHNGYLEIFIETGWIGLGICLAMVLQVFRKLQRLMLLDSVKGRFFMSYLIMFLMFNITEASFKFRGAFFFIFLIITLYAVPEKLPGDEHEASCTHQDNSRRGAVREHQNI